MKKMIALSLLLFVSLDGYSQADSIKNYVTEALGVMKQYSVNKHRLDWDKLYRTAYDSVKKCKTLRETYPSLVQALHSLEDSHSNFAVPEMVAQYSQRYDFPKAKDSLIAGKYAYITIPPIGNFNKEDWKEYVGLVYEKAARLDKANPEAWIIDLRDNDGGMFHPMYAAIQPFLDKKKVVGDIDPQGKTRYFSYLGGKVFYDGKLDHVFENRLVKLKTASRPIFILTSKKTSSSGEFTAVSFVGQKNVRLVGKNTQGLTSANTEYKLSDGAMLILTVGNLVDRNKKEYKVIGEGIAPDILVKGNELQEYVNEIETYLKAKK